MILFYYSLLLIFLFAYVFIVIEKFTDNVRFCLICNYLSKIIPALQSRCTRFRFGPLESDQILRRLNYVIEQEKYVKYLFTVLNILISSYQKLTAFLF